MAGQGATSPARAAAIRLLPGPNLDRSRAARIYASPYPATPDDQIEPLIASALAQVTRATKPYNINETRREYLRRLRANICSRRRKNELKDLAKAAENGSDAGDDADDDADGEYEEDDEDEAILASVRSRRAPTPPSPCSPANSISSLFDLDTLPAPMSDADVAPEMDNSVLQLENRILRLHLARVQARADEADGIAAALRIPEGEVLYDTATGQFHRNFSNVVFGASGVLFPNELIGDLPGLSVGLSHM